MRKYLAIILVITSSCNLNQEKIKSKLELEYSNISDSLKKYKNEIPSNQLDNITIDYIKLSFNDFDEKYKLQPSEFKKLNQSLISTYKIAEALKSIKNNMKITSPIDNVNPDSKDKEYSLNESDKDKYGPVSKDNDEKT